MEFKNIDYSKDLEKNLSKIHIEKFLTVIKVDYTYLSKKTDKFRLDVDVKKVKTYLDLQHFIEDYKNHLSFLGKTQLDMLIKDMKWNKTIYTVLAANKFKKKLLKKKHFL